MMADLSHCNLKCKFQATYVFLSLGIFCVVLCTVTQFYKLYVTGDRTYCTTTSGPDLPPVFLDVDSLYKKTKVILERRVRAGELSSDEEQRILAVLSNSYDDTATVLENTNNKRGAEVPLGQQQKLRKIDEDIKITEMAGLIEILSLGGSDLGEEERIIKEIKRRNYDLIMTKLGRTH